MSTFTGFSEEELKRIKFGETDQNNAYPKATKLMKANFTSVTKKSQQYKTLALQKPALDDCIDDIQFDKCKLSIRTPTTPTEEDKEEETEENLNDFIESKDLKDSEVNNVNENNNIITVETAVKDVEGMKNGLENGNTLKPEIVRGADLTEDDLASHRAKLEELQLKQKLMEEQNKKRKEMLAKALADRTRQTEEEVMKLEKIKKELQVLDGQFSLDVAVLRKKIDQACLSYSDAEKHYLKVEKEFLQAKIQLQKEKEKKELLTEHLCALITHNETRKAQKLETLMLELATNKKLDDDKAKVTTNKTIDDINANVEAEDEKEDDPYVIDGVDQRTGKIVEFTT